MSSLHLSMKICILLLYITKAYAQFYELVHVYNSSNFFTDMNFYAGHDPTDGFVDYVNKTTATALGLLATNQTSVYIGTDMTNTYSLNSTGRPSVRLESKATYNYGLFVLDLEHMPYGCGVWPAWWTVGPNWPANGEIDIIEGVNDAVANSASLHTAPGCNFSTNTAQTGLLVHNDCDAIGENIGCGTQILDANNFGTGFNENGGGVYAMQWTSENITVWFFPRSSIPPSIETYYPDPSTFGSPAAFYKSSQSCDLDKFFYNHTIVLDTTFCGDYAGNVYGKSGQCPQIEGAAPLQSCEQYVASSPQGLQEAYWKINYMTVFQEVVGWNEPGMGQNTTSVWWPSTTAVQAVGLNPPIAVSPVPSFSPDSNGGGGNGNGQHVAAAENAGSQGGSCQS